MRIWLAWLAVGGVLFGSGCSKALYEQPSTVHIYEVKDATEPSRTAKITLEHPADMKPEIAAGGTISLVSNKTTVRVLYTAAANETEKRLVEVLNQGRRNARSLSLPRGVGAVSGPTDNDGHLQVIIEIPSPLGPGKLKCDGTAFEGGGAERRWEDFFVKVCMSATLAAP